MEHESEPKKVEILITFEPPQYSHFHDMKGYQCAMYDFGDYFVMAKDFDKNAETLRCLPKDWATIIARPNPEILENDLENFL